MSTPLLGESESYALQQSETGLLNQIILATKQTESLQVQKFIKIFTQSTLDGVVYWDKNVEHSITRAIHAIDRRISMLLANIMHHEAFNKLEGSWRGLHHLVKCSDTNVNLRIRVLSITQSELYRDFDKAVEFDQSQLYQKIYEHEYGTSGGKPYSVLMGDYEFTQLPQDTDLLRHIAQVAAAAFCPFVCAAAPALFGFDQWSDLRKPRDLAKIFDTVDYAAWQRFRASDESRFVVMTLPRVLSRVPYDPLSHPDDAFEDDDLVQGPVYCWMNAAYTYVQCLTRAFTQYGWCTAIRGAENGGKVEDLPLHTFISEDGDIDYMCPTAVSITDRREAELSRLGFLPLCHYKDTNYAVYFGAQTLHKSSIYDTQEATANAAISARMPYIMATSRFTHYLKIMARDSIGSFKEADDLQAWLNRWIMNYANANALAQEGLKAKYPLMEAQIEVKEIPGSSGAYQAVVWLRPWLQLEELTASMRLVAQLPKIKSH